MSFFAQIKSSANEATELAMKEMLLGAMRSKDLDGAEILHASDFRTAVAHLGMPMGHAVVEEVLMHCNVSADDGSIDFSELAFELQVQRKTLNEQLAREKREKQVFYQSSQAVADADPFARREEQENRVKTDKFTLLLVEYRAEINEIFRDYSNHQITPKEVMQMLGAYGIYPNHRFKLIIEDHRQGEDLSFRDFYAALSSYNPYETLASDTRAAGHCMNDTGKFSINAHAKSESERLFQRQIKRTNIMSRKLQQERSDAEGTPAARRREKLFEDQNPSGDAALYKDSSRIMAALKPFNNDPSMMLTHNKAQMISGVTGSASVIKYNVETKMTREQVLAALRRLDGGTISVVEFERKMYEIGIEIEPLLLKRIRDSLKTGKLDYRGVVAALDTQVFHAKAMDSAVKPEDMAEIKRKVSACLKERAGINGLNTMSSLFRRFDDDSNGLLSYNEFSKACSVFGLSDSLTVAELRSLFHELDINGDGGLDIREFTNGLRGPARGMRLKALRNAYSKADTVNTNDVPVDVMMRIMQLQYHPDVVSGLRSLRHTQTDFIHFMNAASPGKEDDHQPITFEAFTEYWANVSFFIEDDNAFLTLLNNVMGTGNLAPPPPIVLARRTAEGKGAEAASAAVQIHGDIVAWGQEASNIEQSARSTARLYKRPVDFNSPGKSTLNVFHQQPASSRDSKGQQRTARKIDHIESSNIFAWDTSKKGAFKAKEKARQQWERKMDVAKSDADAEETNIRVGAFEIDEVDRMAGAPSKKLAITCKRGAVESAAKNNFGGPSPFATDIDNAREADALAKRLGQLSAAGEAKTAAPTPRALSDLLKEKKSNSGPRSLSEIMDAKAKRSA